MYRNLQEKLDLWRHSARRKPLVLKGARQVGKTYLLKTWGQKEFYQVHYLNFEKSPDAARVFSEDFDVRRIVREIGLFLGSSIDVDRDLLILDEIQACGPALTALKYFCEDLPKLAVCAAGSLLGVMLNADAFPVGKVSFLFIFPMDFMEFARAADERGLWQEIPTPSLTAKVPRVIHEPLWKLLKTYYVTGGMPEVVASYLAHRDDLSTAFAAVRQIQGTLMAGYEADIAKHAGGLKAVHIQALLRNIPSQLSQTSDHSTHRFHFGKVMAGKKGFGVWERPMHWLANAGLVHTVKIANAGHIPLESYTKPNLFKLFSHDVGLLGQRLDIPASALIEQDYGIASFRR